MAASNENPNFIGYCRVSTKRQGESGLGLDAQDHAVKELVEREGGKLVGLYVEVESGKGVKLDD